MSVDNNYQWHYDYARLACDSGFTFLASKSKSSLEKNIGHVDIEQIIRDRDLAAIERHINTVLEFTLDNDQTNVLDSSFVKVFQLGQLSLQYLIFCKRYLDNTVVLIKREFTKSNEEAKHLKRHIDELKQELGNSKKQIKELKSSMNSQMANAQNVPIFQCQDCPKAFSTEEYLLSHIKRRHEENMGPSHSSFQVETDKLQLEIKELKERLNHTEKFIHNDEPKAIKNTSNQSNNDTNINNNNGSNALLLDLQQKFELLKNHVENELRILQTQKFEKEKYEQWFDAFLDKLDKTHGKTYNKNENVIETPTVDNSIKLNIERVDEMMRKTNIGDCISNNNLKTDITTQTEIMSSPKLTVCKNCQAKHSPTFRTTQIKPAYYQQRGTFSDGDNIELKLRMETENHFEKFEELLQEKVSGSMEKFETQMQSFLNKMHEVEKQKVEAANKLNITRSTTSIENINIEEPIVVHKPRKHRGSMKEAFQSVIPRKQNETHKLDQRKLTPVPSMQTITIKEASINFTSNSETESESSEESEFSETSDDESNVSPPIPKPSNVSTLGQRSLTSIKEAAFTPEVLQGLQKEIENVLNDRLEDLGVSPQWTTLPLRSYQRAMSIVTHQTNLIQKNISNYMHIKKRILKDVDQRIIEKKKTLPSKQSKLQKLLSSIKMPKKESKPERSNKAVVTYSQPTINPEVKTLNDELEPNLNMYITDSESDISVQHRRVSKPTFTDPTQKAFSKVIEELNTTVGTKSKEEQSSASEISEIPYEGPTNIDNPVGVNRNDAKMDTLQAKSALKNFLSLGSLQKKKVIFDLESSSLEELKKPVAKANEAGSTTSVGSSVLDGSVTNMPSKATLENSARKSSDLSDISDWELSDVIE